MNSTGDNSQASPGPESSSRSDFSNQERIALAIYIVGLLLALWGLGPRLRAEASHSDTEVLLDATAMAQWIDMLGDRGERLPGKLLKSGISSLAFSELHLDELVENGFLVAQSQVEFRLTLSSGALGEFSADEERLFKASLSERESGTYLVFLDGTLAESLLPQLKILYGTRLSSHFGGRVIWLPVPLRTLRSEGLGFDRLSIEKFQAQGFSIWLRPQNREGLDAETLRQLYENWETLPGVSGVIFGGGSNEAMGYPNLLEESVAELRRLAWKVGYIELPARSQQKGIETLVRELPSQTVRVMAVSPAHQAKLSPYRVLGMYSLGARERNIRLLYVRPYAVAGRPELDEEFLFSLTAELEKAGPASVFSSAENSGPSTLLTCLLSLGGGALALLLCFQLGFAFRSWWWWLLLLPPVAALAAGAVGKAILFRSLLALLVGMAAPTYGFLRFVYPLMVSASEQKRFTRGLVALVLTSLVSLSAGCYLAALLSETTFLLGLDRFRGVKLLTLGTPVLIVLCFVVKRYSASQIWSGLRSYVAVYQAILAGVLAVVLGLLYLRSGNDAGGAASDSERTLRVFLDRAMGVRPRFKEFMMAHPALVCIPLFASKTGFLPTLVLVLLAGIGQAGIVDTFAHVHTPLEVTVIRVFLGVGLGAVAGGAAMGCYHFLGPSLERRFRRMTNIK